MRLRTKLMLSPALSVAMLVIVLLGALAVLAAAKARSDANQAGLLESSTKVSALQSNLGSIHIDLYKTMAVVNSIGDAQLKTMRQSRKLAIDAMKQLARELAKRYASNADAKAALGTFETRLASYMKLSDTAIELSTEAPNAEAMKSADENFTALNQALNDAIATLQKQASLDSAEMGSQARTQALLVGLLGLAAASVSLVFAWVNQNHIYRDIEMASKAAAEVAQGHLDQEVGSSGNDEIADLLRALGSMVQTLRSSICLVREASESIEAASSEIASGNADLSQRTERTSASLQKAASSMDTLTAAVKSTADSAAQVTQLASGAAKVAELGGREVGQVVSTMKDIESSSRRIGDIIGVIDGIAFQTNILALNAAVEAARAGEHGRGFAVVAEEVRTLARRCSGAAKEIRELIVASVERVEAGSRIVGNAGATMEKLLTSVRSVSTNIERISVAASEQRDGISHVNSSIAQLDQVTQQNAALVEQSAAASESLKDQAGTLSKVVSAFKTERS